MKRIGNNMEEYSALATADVTASAFRRGWSAKRCVVGNANAAARHRTRLLAARCIGQQEDD
jgi:hypothetical protein